MSLFGSTTSLVKSTSRLTTSSWLSTRLSTIDWVVNLSTSCARLTNSTCWGLLSWLLTGLLTVNRVVNLLPHVQGQQLVLVGACRRGCLLASFRLSAQLVASNLILFWIKTNVTWIFIILVKFGDIINEKYNTQTLKILKEKTYKRKIFSFKITGKTENYQQMTFWNNDKKVAN